MVARKKWTEEQLIVAVENSRSMAEVCRYLGLKGSGSRPYLTKAIEDLGLDASHFRGQSWSRGNSWSQLARKESLLPLLRKGKKVASLRDRLIASGIKQEKCEECGLTEWQGKPPPLQVDHVDGDHLNNELENLRILCANCHMQTETWGFKNARRRKVWVHGSISLPALSAGGVMVATHGSDPCGPEGP